MKAGGACLLYTGRVKHDESGDGTGRALLVRSSFRIRHQGLNGVDRPGEVAAALVTDQLL